MKHLLRISSEKTRGIGGWVGPLNSHENWVVFSSPGPGKQLITPWKMNSWNLQITHLERKMIWTKPPFLDMFQPLIFQGCNFHETHMASEGIHLFGRLTTFFNLASSSKAKTAASLTSGRKISKERRRWWKRVEFRRFFLKKSWWWLICCCSFFFEFWAVRSTKYLEIM